MTLFLISDKDNSLSLRDCDVNKDYTEMVVSYASCSVKSSSVGIADKIIITR